MPEQPEQPAALQTVESNPQKIEPHFASQAADCAAVAVSWAEKVIAKWGQLFSGVILKLRGPGVTAYDSGAAAYLVLDIE